MSNVFHMLRYPLRVLKQVILLPQHSMNLESINKDIALMSEGIQQVRNSLVDISNHTNEQKKDISEQKRSLQLMDDKFTAVKRSIRQYTPVSPEMVTYSNLNNTMADNHALDQFYKEFEDRFRGQEDDIKIRVSEYLHLFEGLDPSLRKRNIIDIGCGRGEFLSFAKDNKLNAIGIDINKSMVRRANSLGYTAVQKDALTYIISQKNNSLAAITGFHIVEHIPFESLMQLFEECYRSLAHGGFVLFETPNPGNLVVGSCNFYIDPTHIKPIPPDLLAFALESVGFKPEIIFTHPAKDVIDHDDESVKNLMEMVYGPRDYAVVGYKR